jgi:hypothetical protein
VGLDRTSNRFACDAADRAMQTCGGIAYTRHTPFEHIYRHHRRYRITEGSEESKCAKSVNTCSRSAASATIPAAPKVHRSRKARGVRSTA